MKIEAHAHGRVNLIGEHTDYNEGYVLPALIPQRTLVRGEGCGGRRIFAESLNLGEKIFFDLGMEKRSGHWSDYVQGVTSVLAAEGHELPGCEIIIDSDVPLGSGLSSSAALIVALLRFFRALGELGLEDAEIPRLSQKIENEFVGARVGIMDPAACAWAKPGQALFVDTRSMDVRNIPLPEDAELLVISSGISHRNVGGGYLERRGQCEEAGRLLGIHSLRELGNQSLSGIEAHLDALHFRRVRHVITENQRVLDCVAAFESGDLARAGELFDASHCSQRDDYEVSTPEVDGLVELTREQPGVFGSRLTGGGFGGSIVALCRKGAAMSAGKDACQAYFERFSIRPRLLVPEAARE